MKISVSSTIKSATFLHKAEELAIKLSCPFYSSPFLSSLDCILCYTEEGLKLLHLDRSKNKFTTLLFVDFINGKNGFRRKYNATIKQPLAKVVGIKPGYRPTVLDATAGLGGDSFVLATLGCKVTMCERNSIVAELLNDGLQRTLMDEQTKSIVQNKLTLLKEDTRSSTTMKWSQFETVYLDPMYPHDTGSALNKKNMRVIRMVVGDDEDSSELMQCARHFATKRIVVKRPRLAPPLTDDQISYQVKMKSSRYDVYLV